MLATLSALLEPSSLTPHGFCLLWEPGLIWLQAGSDALIGLAYFSIPLVLLTFARRRPDFEFGWVLWLFAAFILACGTTHFMSIVTLWVPLYWLEGLIKLLTAVISVTAAVLLWPLLPRILALPSPSALRRVNAELEHQIQERDRNAAILREREAQLRQSQKMEGLGQLAGGIAHDFNNVLQVISSGLTLIQRRAHEIDTVRQFATMASEAAARGASITGRLLSFARKGDLQAVALTPRTFLEGICEILAHTLGSHIRIEMDVEDNLNPVLADKAQLETVLLNLAVNARDAMPDGGTLTLSAHAETVTDPLGRHGLDVGHYLRLSVTDTGVGMDAATLARAGEPFFTTKPVGQGTGLGLAMARGFAHQSGGGFALHSAPGLGTQVTIWLPKAPAAALQPDAVPAGRSPSAFSAGAYRVMVVDDNAMIRDLLSTHLEDQGYRVSRASDGLEALAELDGGAAIDILITDFAMPGMNGLTLIEEVRRRLPLLPALLLTGYADQSVRMQIEEHPDDLIVMLRKPVSGDDLAAHTAALLKVRAAVSS